MIASLDYVITFTKNLDSPSFSHALGAHWMRWDARADDNPEAIKKRLATFTEVLGVLGQWGILGCWVGEFFFPVMLQKISYLATNIRCCSTFP